MDKKVEALKQYLQELESCAIALSGGQDSAFLLDMARQILGDGVAAFTVFAPYTIKRDLRKTHGIIKILGVRHQTIDIPLPESLRYNPAERCYLCKNVMVERIAREALSMNITNLLDGTNADDNGDDRPGMRALRERGVLSPLQELGFTKEEIAHHLRERGREAWIGPADSCLLTRLPPGCEATPETLTRIEMAEEYLIEEGFEQVRVRSDGISARIEVARDMRPYFFNEERMDTIAEELKRIGFRYLSLDLEGYRCGSMNRRNGE